MKTEPVRWKDWEALRCTAGDAELVVGFTAGPRVLSLRWGGSPDIGAQAGCNLTTSEARYAP
jgi:hypothetical protein